MLLQGREINIAAFRLAREVADEGDALVSISLTETKSYAKGESKDVVQAEFEQQLSFFRDEGCDIDFIVCEVRPATRDATSILSSVRYVPRRGMRRRLYRLRGTFSDEGCDIDHII